MDLKTTPLSASMSLNELRHQGLVQSWERPYYLDETEKQDAYRFTPSSAEEVAFLLHWAQANRVQLICREEDARHAKSAAWLDVGALQHIRQYTADDLVIQVETGMTAGALDAFLAPYGQMLPLSYPATARLLDLLAEDRPALETGFRGMLRDYVLKTEIATPDGQLSVSGADVVKNVTGYDLHKLYVGGQHAFGVITAVTLKLMARPAERRFWLYVVPHASDAYALHQTLQKSHLPLTICEIFQSGTQWQLLIAMGGQPALLDECHAHLLRLASDDTSETSRTAHTATPSPRCLNESDTTSLLTRLQSWPVDIVVLEAAFPLGQWPFFHHEFLQDARFAGWKTQIRPEAGLIYLLAPWPFSAEEEADSENVLLDALRALRAEITRYEGFFQIVQYPGLLPVKSCSTALEPQNEQSFPGLDGVEPATSLSESLSANAVGATRGEDMLVSDRTGQAVPSEALPAMPEALDVVMPEPWLAEFNLPECSITRDLLKSLKHSYDPNSSIVTPYLPL